MIFKTKNIFRLILFLTLFINSRALADNTITYLDSISNAKLREIAQNLLPIKPQAISLCFADKNSEVFLKENAIRIFCDKSKIYDCKNSDSLFKIDFNINEFKILYEPTELNDDSLKRSITIKGRANFTDFNKMFLNPIDINFANQSFVLKSDLIETKNSKYASNCTEIPKSKTFWEEYFEPIAIVGTAGLIVYGLFTVRSK